MSCYCAPLSPSPNTWGCTHGRIQPWISGKSLLEEGRKHFSAGYTLHHRLWLISQSQAGHLGVGAGLQASAPAGAAKGLGADLSAASLWPFHCPLLCSWLISPNWLVLLPGVQSLPPGASFPYFGLRSNVVSQPITRRLLCRVCPLGSVHHEWPGSESHGSSFCPAHGDWTCPIRTTLGSLPWPFGSLVHWGWCNTGGCYSCASCWSSQPWVSCDILWTQQESTVQERGPEGLFCRSPFPYPFLCTAHPDALYIQANWIHHTARARIEEAQPKNVCLTSALGDSASSSLYPPWPGAQKILVKYISESPETESFHVKHLKAGFKSCFYPYLISTYLTSLNFSFHAMKWGWW